MKRLRRNSRIFIGGILFLFAAPGVFVLSLHAEKITLNNGTIIEGKVVEETDEYIRIMDEAGFIHKYLYSQVQEVAIPNDIPPLAVSDSQTPENISQAPKMQIDEVRGQLQDNLKKTESMIQETLRKLYALPSDEPTPQSPQKNKTDQLQQERDNKYRQNKKYY